MLSLWYTKLLPIALLIQNFILCRPTWWQNDYRDAYWIVSSLRGGFMIVWPRAWERWLWGDGGVNQRDCGDHLSKHCWWSLSHIPLSVTPRTAHKASLSFTVSRSLLKLMSSEWTMPSSRLILYRPLLLLFSILPRPSQCLSYIKSLHVSIKASGGVL